MRETQLLNKIRISPGLALFAAFIIFSNALANRPFFNNIVLLYIYGSILIHELAHAVVGEYLGYKTERIKIIILGGFVEFNNLNWMNVPRHRFYISLAGPVSNLLLAGLFINFYDLRIAEFNFLIAAFNLIPIMPMDGGGMVAAICDNYSFNKIIAPSIGVMSASIAILFFNIDILGIIFLTFFSIGNLFFILFPGPKNG